MQSLQEIFYFWYCVSGHAAHMMSNSVLEDPDFAAYAVRQQHTVVSPERQPLSRMQHLLTEQGPAIEQLQVSC